LTNSILLEFSSHNPSDSYLLPLLPNLSLFNTYPLENWRREAAPWSKLNGKENIGPENYCGREKKHYAAISPSSIHSNVIQPS
jgi:hypothetical protein